MTQFLELYRLAIPHPDHHEQCAIGSEHPVELWHPLAKAKLTKKKKNVDSNNAPKRRLQTNTAAQRQANACPRIGGRMPLRNKAA